MSLSVHCDYVSFNLKSLKSGDVIQIGQNKKIADAAKGVNNCEESGTKD